MPNDPVTGPIPRQAFKEIINAPHGEAKKLIRKYDPMFGREDGEIVKWRVGFQRKVWEHGTAYVEAATEKEAEKLAEKIPDNQIDWDIADFGDEGEIHSIEVAS